MSRRGNGASALPRHFRRVDEGHYELSIPDVGIIFEVERLRRKWGELVGELSVRCNLAGALTYDGVLSASDLNLSNQKARQERAVYLAARARTRGDFDWLSSLEEFVQRVLTAERAGEPSLDLRSLPRPAPDDFHDIDGLVLPRRHPSIIFGDGGAAKSYLELYFLGRLARKGIRVGLFDWELAGDDHRDRLERLFDVEMPEIQYVRCEHPLVFEVERLRRVVREHALDFAGFDSVAFACDGPPEAAEVASRYFRAVRQIGIGSLHIAHVSKADGSDQKPFGSTFWHNGARSTWFAKLAEATPDGRTIQLGLFNRKSNLGALRASVGYEIRFSPNETQFRRIDLADVPDLAAKLSVRQRMVAVLRRGSMPVEALALEIGAGADTVRRTARRNRNSFVLLDGGYLGLANRRDV